MTERLYLATVGVFILLALYFELDIMIYGLCIWLIIEGVTDIRLTTLSQKLFPSPEPVGLTMFASKQRFDFEALRATRIVIATFLGGSFILLNQYNVEVLWFFPWFMGFAILGAGASGVCPIVLMTKWFGFK